MQSQLGDRVSRKGPWMCLGVIDIVKLARALHLRWPWLKWHDKGKIWVGTGNPCTYEDMTLFYAATTITVSDGNLTPFWEASWLD